MPNNYIEADDGKLHTRYSELMQCTRGSIKRVAKEHIGLATRYANTSMAFGTLRHEMFEAEARETGLTAACFLECGFQVEATYIEKEFATEIFDGVILHSRPDVYSAPGGMIIDYKTAIRADLADHYRRSLQHMVYAYQLYAHGIRAKKAVYLIEIWNPDHTVLTGYRKLEVPITLKDIIKIRGWIRQRVELLQIGIEYVQKSRA
jgi:hypothetical protein